MVAHPPEFLIIAPAWVGDMVMAQTFFKLLKSQYPNHAIDVLAPTWTHGLLERMPEVRAALSMPLKHGELGLLKRFRIARQLHLTHRYEAAFLLPNSFKSALIPFFAGIKKRVGWLGEARYGLLNDSRRLDKTAYPKMVQRFAALAFPAKTPLPTVLPYPSLKVNPAVLEKTLQRLKINPKELHHESTQPVMVLCPGAEFGPSKRWPIAYFAEVAKHYHRQGWQVWIMGSAKDNEVANQITAASPGATINLTGLTSLAEAVDLLSYAKVVVTNDSGLMHVAAAVDTPLVVFYGSTSADFTPPLAERVKILKSSEPCSPCFQRDCPLGHHNCMNNLVPDQAIAAIEAIQELVPACVF